MPIQLRPARADERAALEALQLRASIEHPTYREQILANPEVIVLPDDQIADGRVMVAEDDANLRGFAVVLPRDDGQAELDGLFVEPDGWRGGIGRRLVGWAASYAQGLGAARLCVVANPDAMDFYLAVGFVETGIMETQFAPASVMELTLVAARP
jgi:GNAT superfamily N-acetyltransferase